MANLTADERDRIRYHLGYGSTSPAATIALGIPGSTMTMYLVEKAMDNLLTVAVPRVQRTLARLDAIEDKLEESQDYLAAAAIDGLKLRPTTTTGESHPDALEREYLRWARRLADILNCQLNPYALRWQGGSRAVTNVRVSG